MPRNNSKTIVTAIAGDKESLALARLENLKKAREKALELRLLRNTQSASSVDASASGVQKKSRRRITAEPVSPTPTDAKLVPKMDTTDEQTEQSSEPEQPTKPKRGRPPGSGKRKHSETAVAPDSTATITDGADGRGHEEPKSPCKLLHGGSGERDATPAAETPVHQQSPRTPPGNVSTVSVAHVPDSVEEGELDPSPPPPTEMSRGRSKNNRRKPTTVQRKRTRPSSVDTVRRRLDFDRFQVPVAGGAFYRNNVSGHFTFNR
jgi:hypothetical protein